MQPCHIVLGRADHALPERRAQRRRCPAGYLRVEQAAAQVDDLCGQVPRRLGQLGGLILLGHQGFLLGLQRLALLGQGRRLVRLCGADDLQLVVHLLRIGCTLGAQGIGLALNLHGRHAQLRQQVVVGITGDALANLVQSIAKLVDGRGFVQCRCVSGSLRRRRRGRCRPGWVGRCHNQHQQQHHAVTKAGKADTPHRTFLFAIRSGERFYAASGHQERAVSRASNCRLRSIPQR